MDFSSAYNKYLATQYGNTMSLYDKKVFGIDLPIAVGKNVIKNYVTGDEKPQKGIPWHLLNTAVRMS